MSEHFEYLQRLLRGGKLQLAGPAFEPLFGLIVLVADSEREAWELGADPSVRAGIQTAQLQPFRASLMAGRDQSVDGKLGAESSLRALSPWRDPLADDERRRRSSSISSVSAVQPTGP